MGFAKLSLKGRALKLLGQREHSRLELERKLAPHVEEGEDLGAMLDALEQRGFISAERVAESVLHRKAARFGTSRMVQELRSKGLDDGLVRAAAEQLRATECSAPMPYGASASAHRRPPRRNASSRCAFWPRAALAEK